MTQIAETGVESRQLASGTTYYIDPVNGVDSPNTTGGLTTPFKTITYAGGFAGPGDTVNLRGTGHYNNPAVLSRSCIFDKSWAGTADNVVTVQSYPGETAIFDPGYPEFISNPNTAWVPCTDTGAHPDEYISANTYTMVSNDGAFGSFLHANGQAGDRLLTYARLEDLRATNESFVRVPVSDPRAGQPIWGDTGYKWLWTYRGPGLWWDPATQKIHARFSATHFNQPGVTDYSGSTDPRTLSLSVSLYGHYAVNVMSDYITFKNIVVQNGGNKSAQLSGSGSDYAEHVTFDHCTFNMSRNGFNFTLTKHARLLHCVFSGNLPSYVCRSDVKDSFDFVNAQGQKESAGCCRMTAACLLTSGGANDEDMEIAYCEFRNGHDGAHIFAYRPRVHHNLFENLNDEAVMFYGAKPAEDVRIYNNVFRKVLMAFSSSEGSWTSTGARYLYRNVIDQRVPTLGYRQLSPDPVLLWRYGQDFKFNLPVPEFYCYQNTFVMPDFGTNECSNVWSNISATAQWTRRYMNNIYMVIQTDKPLYFVPPGLSGSVGR